MLEARVGMESASGGGLGMLYDFGNWDTLVGEVDEKASTGEIRG